jgi:hypothetical protein
MNAPSNNQFGLIVAYLLPGFIGLAGIAPFIPAVSAWLVPATQAEASLGPPLYALLAATTIGMIVSCFRWLVVDHVHQWTGVVPPAWDDSRLEQRLTAFNYLVDSHYRYYQFVANTFVAVVWAYSINRWMGTSSFLGVGTDLGVLILCAVLLATSRDALVKYYTRTDRLIGKVGSKTLGDDVMYNGNHHELEAGASPKPRPEPKPQSKPEPAPKSEPGKQQATQTQK